MAITYQNQRYTGFQEYINRKVARRGSVPADSTPDYAHPVDGWILRTLNATPVRAVMSKAMDIFISINFGHMLSSSIHIDQNSFPDLFEVLSHCARTLDIPVPHAVARQGSDLFNAGTAGTDEYHFIMISSTLCQYYTRDEACFVIGHECGHIASSHMMYHTLVRILTEAIAPRLAILACCSKPPRACR
ncbi:MAG: M48 family metalloprotease [Chloroflexaceae bacterium]|nr:M48 family metalloprotease [Chloroflexaceae bacterium]